MKLLPLACWMSSIALSAASAQQVDRELEEFLSLDLDELTVTSVSRREERLSDAAAAVYVITQEDIRRMGVTSIPEALRAVPGLQVAQIGSNQWAVTSRGFNGALANKLLVLIDGRTIYTPVYSGTYWDDQDTLLEDVERIEVIRGPGASLWGANAVNGIISIITKHSADTQGEFLSAAVGTEERKQLAGRHGGRLSDSATYRIYAKYFDRDDSERVIGGENADEWDRLRSGFRVDGELSRRDSYTLQGDIYGGGQEAYGNRFSPTPPYYGRGVSENNSYGGNVLGRWNRRLTPDSETSLQVYADHYTRLEETADQHVSTLDVDFQHNMELDERHNFIWGAGYRVFNVDADGSFTIDLEDKGANYDTFSAFIQDEYALIPGELFLTFGSKFEHNDFTGGEVQPSGRLLWKATPHQTLWASVSRAVRVPSLIEDSVTAAVSVRSTEAATPAFIRLYGNKDLEAEELVAYEAGYRIQPVSSLSFDTSFFFNDYDRLVSYRGGAPFMSGGAIIQPFTVANLGQGHTYGAELASSWDVTSWWKLSAAYSYITLDLRSESGPDYLEGTEEGSPNHQFSVRSYMEIADGVQWDNALYYVDDITPGSVTVGDYIRLDSRIAWEAAPGLELSLVGRNLLDSGHQEYPGTFDAEIERSVLGAVSMRF